MSSLMMLLLPPPIVALVGCVRVLGNMMSVGTGRT